MSISSGVGSPASSTDPAIGLTGAQAAARLIEDGPNEVSHQAGPTVARTVLHQLTDTVIVVLLVAAVLTAAVGDATDTAVILAVIMLNTALGAAQELRSGHALEALRRLTAPRATVVRDGQRSEIDARQVVRGDVITLTAGDILPADAVVVAGEALQTDESMLTGESIPVGRGIGNIVHAGTVVTRGRGTAIVTEVADATAVGHIARSLRETTAPPTPVQRQLATLGRRLAGVVAVAAIVVGVLNIASGRGVETSVVLAISLAVAAIPESLPAVVSLAHSMAARRMSNRGVLVRRLPAVEALGSVTVVAADKTGTLTEGRLSVEQLWTPGSTVQEERALLLAGVLCNDACSGRGGEGGQRDDPLEVALVDAARNAGVDALAERARAPRIAEQPFDAATARMTTTHRLQDGRSMTVCKGSPESVLRDVPGGVTALAVAEQMGGAGLRMLALTMSTDDDRHVLGLVAFRDPPRAGARELIEAFRRAGIRPMMITGDHPATARAVAAAVGITADDALSRVLPEEKSAIVAGLRADGDIVAMTGDGVNDAPALRAADIGVAMGERATEVARQAADIVLTRDDLSVLIPAVGEGRRVHDNLRRFLHYGLSGGLAEILVMLAGPLLGFAMPLQAGQILWVNLLTHGLPGVALGNEPAERDVLRRPPRPVHEHLLDATTARRVAVLGAVIAACCLAAGLFARQGDRPWQTTIFVTVTFAQLGVALALHPSGIRRAANPMLPAAVALNVVLAVAAVAWQPLRELLHTAPMTPVDLLICVGAGVPAAAVALIQTRYAPTWRPRAR